MNDTLWSASLAALHGRARRFTGSRRGGIAPAAALIMMPILMLAFGGVEFHRYTTVRSNVQDAVDAAALAVARSSSSDPAFLQQTGEAVLRAQVPFSANLRLTSFTVNVDRGVIVADALISITPIIASMFMSGDLKIASRSEVLREVRGLEVALVLDNTGSMATNDRIGIAKTAAKNFIDKMAAATAGTTTPDSVRIAIVPFANTVNVGAANQTASATWLDQAGASPIHQEVFWRGPTGPKANPQPRESWAAGTPNRFTMLSQLGVGWGGCVESRPYPHDVQDTTPSPGTPASLFVPYFAPDEPDQATGIQSYAYPNNYVRDVNRAMAEFRPNGFGGWLGQPWPEFYADNVYGAGFVTAVQQFYLYAAANGNAADVWRGVQGRAAKYAGGETATGLNLTGGKGPNRGCAIQPITRLTNNYVSLKSSIDAMTIGGATNIPMGLAWGWHMVSPNMPFGGSPATTAGVKRVVVLMTDGDNSLWSPVDADAGNWNRSEYSGAGYAWQNRLGTTSNDAGERARKLNERLTELCANMRGGDPDKPKVLVYTIRVEVTGGDPSLLRNCATYSDMFFDVRNASDLSATFDKIARSIQNLRVAK